jgi:microcystin degradation protein MlrC
VIVKNPMNYLAAYSDAPAKMVLDTPGPTTCNLAAVPWRYITRPRFPIDTDFGPQFDRLT